MKSLRPLLLTLSLIFVGAIASAQTLPNGFATALVANVGGPTALAFTPDGRLLIGTKGGAIRVLKNGTLLSTAALTFNTSGTAGSDPRICTESERGLLGIAVDPAFAVNGFVYLFYTARNGSGCQTGGDLNYGTATTYNATGLPVNRVSRFTFGTGPNADVIDPATEVIVVNNMPSRGGNHNAGDVHFGKDGKLYIAIGDGGRDYASGSGRGGEAGSNIAARDKHVLTGKILRVNADGSAPADNPFIGVAGTAACAVTGATTAGNHCAETFAWGLRNPFRFSMDMNAVGTRFYINDVGQGVWEEVSESQAGADYGWNLCEGRHNNGSSAAGCSNASGVTPAPVFPVYEYRHGTLGVPGTSLNECNSITAGAFVPNELWTPAYNGRYVVSDFVCDAIWTIATTGTPAVPVVNGTILASGVNGPTTTIFGPYGSGQALYVASLSESTVRAIYFASALLDIDGNGVPDAATDGVLLQRYLFGFRNTELLAGAVGAGATRNGAQIESYLQSRTSGSNPAFKVSTGTEVSATRDGLIALRHLLGVTGDALTNGVPLSLPLDTATKVRNYLLTRSP